jgi:hypothetical protein
VDEVSRGKLKTLFQSLMLGSVAVSAFAHAQATGAAPLPALSFTPLGLASPLGASSEPEANRGLSYFRRVDDDGLQLSSFLASRAAQDAANYRLYLGLGYTQSLTSFARFSGRTFYGTGTYDGANEGSAVPDEVRSAADPGAWLGSNWQVESKLFDRHSFFAGVEYRQQVTMPLTELSELLARTDSTGLGQPARKVGFVTRSRFTLSAEYAINVRTRFDEGSGSLNPTLPLSTTDSNRLEVGMERNISGGSRTQLSYSWQTSSDGLAGSSRLDQRLTKLRMDMPASTRISTGFEVQYLNVLDPTAALQNRDFVIGNLSIAGHDVSDRTRISLGLNNVFGVKDGSADAARLMSSIPIDGRSFRLDVARKL